MPLESQRAVAQYFERYLEEQATLPTGPFCGTATSVRAISCLTKRLVPSAVSSTLEVPHAGTRRWTSRAWWARSDMGKHSSTSLVPGIPDCRLSLPAPGSTMARSRCRKRCGGL